MPLLLTSSEAVIATPILQWRTRSRLIIGKDAGTMDLCLGTMAMSRISTGRSSRILAWESGDEAEDQGGQEG